MLRVTVFLFPSFLLDLFFEPVPDNPNFSISSQLKPEEVIPEDLGGSDFSELIYDRNLEGQKWMVPCFSGIGTDDAADVCRGFAKGYLRKYTTYKLLDGTVAGGDFLISLDTSVLTVYGEWTTVVYDNENLRGKYALLVNILEYDSSDDAKSSCSFLITDSSYKTIQIDDVNILIKEWEGGDWSHYVLPTDKTVISIQGTRAAVEEAMNEVVEKYKNDDFAG